MQRILFFLLAVIGCLDSKGQTEMDSPIGKSLATIYGERQPTTINLFFHQPAYAPGDTAFFQASYVMAEMFKPVAGKQLLHLVVTNASGVLMVRQSFYVKDGTGSNQIILPADIPAGLYRLVCWSNTMRNYDPSLFYQQVLEVVGEKKNIPVKPNSSPAIQTEGAGNILKTKFSDESLEISGEVSAPGESPLFLFLVKGRKIFFSKKISTSPGQSFSVTISPQVIPQGFYQILIFKEDKSLWAQRLLFNRMQKDELVSLVHPKETGTRSLFEVNVQAKSITPANFAVTIYQSALFRNRVNAGAVAGLELFSNLENTMYSPAASLSLDSAQTLNDALATQQWKLFDWDSAAKGLIRKAKFPTEHSLSMKGKVFNKQTGELLPAPTFVTFYFENSTFVQGVYTDENGYFKMDLQQPISIKEKAYYKVDFNEQELTDAGMQLLEETHAPPASKSDRIDAYDPYFSYNNLKRSAEFSFNHVPGDLKKLAASRSQNQLLEEETMGVDVEYKMSEYKVFNSMEEIAIEILPRVVYRKIKGKVTIRMNIEEWGETKHELSKGSPIYVIDGVMTSDTDFFLSLNPADLDKIKLLWSVEKRRVLGALGVNGVLLVETKNPALASRVPTSHSLNLAGISDPIDFVQKLPGKDPRKPFLKPVLYWNPKLSFDGEGKRKITFVTSDDIGEYTIEVTGIDENGRPFFKRSNFKVTPGSDH